MHFSDSSRRSSPQIDWDEFLAMCGDNFELAVSILDALCQDMESLSGQLAADIDSRAQPEILRGFHTLKRSVQMIGGPVFSLAESAEAIAWRLDSDSSDSKYQELSKIYESLIDAWAFVEPHVIEARTRFKAQA